MSFSLRPRFLYREVTPNSGKKVWWQCKKGHEWQAQVSNRIIGRGCPFCSGRRPSQEYNIKALHPNLALEWNDNRNGSLTPEEVTPGSGKRVWWQCSKRHEWIAQIFRNCVTVLAIYFMDSEK